VNDQNPDAPDRITKLGFEPIKHQLKRDLVRYEDKVKKASEAGKASAEAKRIARQALVNQQASTDVNGRQQSSTDSTVTVTDTDNVTDIDILNTPQPVVATPNPEKEPIKVHPLQTYVKEHCPRVSKLSKQLTYEEAEAITKEFDRTLIKTKLEAMENKKKLDYVSVNLTLRNWLKNGDFSGTPAATPNAPMKMGSGKIVFTPRNHATSENDI
jgi:GTP cyclohydrolase III